MAASTASTGAGFDMTDIVNAIDSETIGMAAAIVVLALGIFAAFVAVATLRNSRQDSSTTMAQGDCEEDSDTEQGHEGDRPRSRISLGKKLGRSKQGHTKLRTAPDGAAAHEDEPVATLAPVPHTAQQPIYPALDFD